MSIDIEEHSETESRLLQATNNPNLAISVQKSQLFTNKREQMITYQGNRRRGLT